MSAKDKGKRSSEAEEQGGAEEVTDNAEAVPKGSSENHQENLFTKVINVDNKSYFLDVRENKRGKYLKLSESSEKKRSTILLSGHVVSLLVQILDDAIKENYKRDENLEMSNKWVTVLSKRAVSLQKKIYFDLMENKFGRSLNIAELSQNRPKTAVIVSEKGWFHLKRALDEVMTHFPTFQPQTREKVKVLLTKKLSYQAKGFFLDLQESSMGRILKISEMRKSKRETVMLPDVCFTPLIELLDVLSSGDFSKDVKGLEKSSPKEEAEDSGHVTLDARVLKIEAGDAEHNKKFNLNFRSNDYGKFLQVIEYRPGKSNAIFLPEDSFSEVKACLEECLAHE